MTNEPEWTDQQLDRFMAAEICIDELMAVNDEFPGYFPAALVRALREAQQGPFDGFASEHLAARGGRMADVQKRLQAAFPVKHRTHAERIMKEPA